LPSDAYLALPPCAFTQPTNSFTFFAGTSALTASTLGCDVVITTGTRSLAGSYGVRVYMNGANAMGPLKPMPIVWPSGWALATVSMPSMPPAPALFSTTTGWPQRSFSLSPSRRTMMSSELPAGAGTTMRTGRAGHGDDCARALKDSAVPAASARR
jgi:hypothetical protein